MPLPGNCRVPARRRAAHPEEVSLAPPSSADPDAPQVPAVVGSAAPVPAVQPAGGAVPPGPVRGLVPGLAVAATAVAGAWAAHQLVAPLSILTAAVVLGVLAANLHGLPEATRPG